MCEKEFVLHNLVIVSGHHPGCERGEFSLTVTVFCVIQNRTSYSPGRKYIQLIGGVTEIQISHMHTHTVTQTGLSTLH